MCFCISQALKARRLPVISKLRERIRASAKLLKKEIACQKAAHIDEEDDGEADGAAAEALHNPARAVDEAARSAHVARQHHLRAHLQLYRRPALRRQRKGVSASSGLPSSP